MIIYGLKNCDSCRKALKSLPDAVLVDVRAEGVPAAIVAQAEDRFGAALINTRSTTWRGMKDSDRNLPVSDLLRAYPAAMKRPLIVAGDGGMWLGWTDATRAGLGVG